MGVLRYIAVALIVCMMGSRPLTAAPPSEYQLKAVFLFNFAQFVEWPPEAFATPDAPLGVCVLGEDPFGRYLDEAVRGESVGGHPLTVARYRDVDEVGGCHILFVSPSEAARLPRILARTRDRSILTVTDLRDTRADSPGVVIGFFTERRRVQLQIDIEAANAARLTLSSKLLRIARLVGEPKV